MNSPIKLIVNGKTLHIRELVVNQKSKRTRSKRFVCPKNSIKHARSLNNKYELKNVINDKNVLKYNYNVRGYDYIKHKTSNLPKSKGFVSYELQMHIENLCNSSEVNFNKHVILYNFAITVITFY